MKRALLLGVRDLFSGTVFWFVLKVTLLALGASVGVIWLLKDLFKGYVATYLSYIPWQWLQETLYGVGVVMLGYALFIALLALFASLGSEPLLRRLAQKHYPAVKAGSTSNLFGSLRVSLQSSLWFFVLFALTFPLVFIPVLGLIWLLYLWSIPLKNPSLYDVSDLFSEEKAFRDISTKETTLLAMAAASLNLLPFTSILSPVFAQIVMMHYVLSRS